MYSSEKNSTSSSTTHSRKKGKNLFNKSTEDSFFSGKTGLETSPFFGGSNHAFNPVLQPQLETEQQEDPFEKEAEQVADSVINRSSKGPSTITEIQTQPEEEEEEQLQRQEQEEEPVQPLQFKSAESPSDHSISNVASQVQSDNSRGSPLPHGVRSSMENSIGADFSGVRVHNDSKASQMSKDLNAKAFTHDQDIYFNEGQYNPDTTKGKHLLAHELTHTVQQGGSDVKQKPIQKAVDTSSSGNSESSTSTADTADASTSNGEAGIDINNNQITIPSLDVPEFKESFYTGSGESGAYRDDSFSPKKFAKTDRSGKHISEWESNVELDLSEHEDDIKGTPITQGEGENKYYYLKLKGSSKKEFFEDRSAGGYLFGTKSKVESYLKRPYWDRDGNYNSFHVDHMVELQTGGADSINNLWMLDASINTSSGSLINNHLNNRIGNVIDQSSEEMPDKGALISKVKNEFTINTLNGLNTFSKGKAANFTNEDKYAKSDIEKGDSLEGVEFMTEKEINEIGGSPDQLYIYTSLTGRTDPIIINWSNSSEGKLEGINKNIGGRGRGNVTINAVNYQPVSSNENEGQGGRGKVFASILDDDKVVKGKDKAEFELEPIPGVPYAGYITHSSVKAATFDAFGAYNFSPVLLDEVELTSEGFAARGKVKTGIPIIDNAELDLIIDPDGVRLSKQFTAEEFNFPSPFSVSNSTLQVSVNTEGVIGINGQTDFEIEGVGQGHIGAGTSTEGGFSLEGSFNFDTQLFEEAEVSVSYKEEQFSISGKLVIPEDKVQGIESATINVSYEEDTFSAEGEAELSVPGFEKGSLAFEMGENGWSISGGFDLSSDVPGIQSGHVEAAVAKSNEEEGYTVTATGEAQPDIPGIDSSITISYEDGVIDITGNVAYERDLLSGTINVGVTNRNVDEETGELGSEKTDELSVYGGGELTMTLTPWLEATAGVQFEPNGEIVVSGEIGLPDTVDVFKRIPFDRTLFRAPTIEIPLFAIPLGPRSVGLVATINGSLGLNAGIGPGQLRELKGGITYNPDRPEETTLTGSGEFVIPANAELTLSADVGVGASIAAASITGGIELAGTLGLEGEAAAEVDVNWTPESGIELHAEGSIKVNPKFTFEVNALLRASLSLLVTSISKEWRYNLASFEWGPDIQFGVIFPIDYIEGEPFDLSFDDVEFITPDIDIPEMAKDLALDIKDKIL